MSGAISTQNTLLAAMSRSKSTTLSPSSPSSGSGNPEDDPDSIWRRRPSSAASAAAAVGGGGGNIGHIDRLGRYRSHFERAAPPSDAPGETKMSDMKSSAAAFVGSKLPKAVKRFVSSDIDAVQEELAWQMAERIVKDVCDVTMSPPPANSDK